MSYIFYDTETTGLNYAFDQIVSFAAIRTNCELEIIEKFETRCRILPYIIPSPEALLVNGISVKDLTDPTLPSHYEMVCLIHKKLSEWTPAIFIGHNSINFDENFLRHAFYKNLLQPYLTNTNKNCRADSMRMAQVASFVTPEILKIPKICEKNSFSLEKLAAANGFFATQSHSAINDANAILHLCRILFEKTPDVWSNFVRFAQKATVNDFVYNEDLYCYCEYNNGVPFSSLFTTLGANENDGNEIFAYNLSFDPDEIIYLSDEKISNIINNNTNIVISFRSNACPAIFPEYDSPDFSGVNHLSTKEIQRRVTRVKNNSNFRERIIKIACQNKKEWDSSPFVEKQIYDKFLTKNDQLLMDLFHKLPWESRYKFLEGISDERIRELGARIIYAERPDVLTLLTHNSYSSLFANRILENSECDWMTYEKAINQIEHLKEINPCDKSKIISDLRVYLDIISKNAAQRLDNAFQY